MKQSERTRDSLIMHYRKYPLLQIQDIFKYIHQSSFGCEHMVSSLKVCTDYIRTEKNNCTLCDDAVLVEPLDGAYSRVSLNYLSHGLSAQTLGKLFFESSREEPDGKSDAENKLKIAKELAAENKLPFAADEFEKASRKWQSDGYPSVHHSDIFRKEYNPAYRVISNKYVPFLPIFAHIDQILQNGPSVLAIEGGSASGKSTLSDILKKLYGGTVFHMDDFFLRPEQRTPERYTQIGGNVDHERFMEEVLLPLKKNEPVYYRKFDCSTQVISPPIRITPEKLVVVEGVYSMHPEFGKYYDLSVFLDVSPELQKARIAKRNSPHIASAFHNRWIPLENLYFAETQIKNRCDMLISIQK